MEEKLEHSRPGLTSSVGNRMASAAGISLLTSTLQTSSTLFGPAPQAPQPPSHP
jgi:hypothetical protein